MLDEYSMVAAYQEAETAYGRQTMFDEYSRLTITNQTSRSPEDLAFIAEHKVADVGANTPSSQAACAEDLSELQRTKEDLWDAQEEMARQIKELAERNQLLAGEINRLALRITLMGDRMVDEDLVVDQWDKSEEKKMQIFKHSGKYHHCPVPKKCSGGNLPDTNLQLPLRVVRALGKEPCHNCFPSSP